MSNRVQGKDVIESQLGHESLTPSFGEGIREPQVHEVTVVAMGLVVGAFFAQFAQSLSVKKCKSP